MAKSEKPAKPAKGAKPAKQSRRSQIAASYRMTKQADPRIGLILLATFVVAGGIAYLLTWLLLGGWIFPVLNGILIGSRVIPGVNKCQQAPDGDHHNNGHRQAEGHPSQEAHGAVAAGERDAEFGLVPGEPLFPVTAAGLAAFPGSAGDIFWGGITGPRYFMDPQQRLIGLFFMQRPSERAAVHAEFRAAVYGAMRPALMVVMPSLNTLSLNFSDSLVDSDSSTSSSKRR